MVKDHFYYCLRDRLEFAREYAHDCATRLRHTEINKKADYDFSFGIDVFFFAPRFASVTDPDLGARGF